MLEDNTLVRHKTGKYTGKVEGNTKIRELFTGDKSGESQYRIKLADGSIKIAPEADLESLSGKTVISMWYNEGGFFDEVVPNGTQEFVCNLGISIDRADAAEVVFKQKFWSDEHVRSRNARWTLNLKSNNRFELTITGIGHDNRCRWCRTFRQSLKTACIRKFGEYTFSQESFCKMDYRDSYCKKLE